MQRNIREVLLNLHNIRKIVWSIIEVETYLMPVVDFVPSNSRITIRSYPHAGKIIGVNFVVDKLTQTVFVYVDAASLAVMNFALNDCRVGTCFNFKAGDAVVVNIVSFKISLEKSIRNLHFT